jgi:trimethylamine:corrinoid methyltransferase-like protein
LVANRRLTIGRVVDEATAAQMHAAAREILARTGMAVEHPDILAEITRHAGFTLKGGRVCIAPDEVDRWTDAFRRRCGTPPPRSDETDPSQFTYSASDRHLWMVERDHTTVRPMRRDDVIEGTKLITALASRGVRPCCAGVPTDVPFALQPVEQFMIAAEYSPGGGWTSQVTDIPTAEVVRELGSVYGRELHLSAWCPSGLRLTGPEVNIIWHFRRDVKSIAVGTMPTMGITGPCDPIAVTTFSLAECIGGAVILAAVLPGVPTAISSHPEPADMQSGQLLLGTPEWELLDLMHRDVLGWYGVCRSFKMTHTCASVPDAQVQVERATSALLGVLSGYTDFGPIGQLGLDEVWCAAQVLLDLAIIADAARIARGVESGEGLELDRLPEVVDEVVRGGLIFAEHESTVRNMRRQYHRPGVFRRMNRAQWMGAGMPSVLGDAQRQVDRLVASYHYEPPQDILRELRKIAARARERLTT